MTANGFEVEGRQFRVRADYEAALRDKKKIDGIRSGVNFMNKEEILKLYARLEAGEYRFESLVGNDFDDEVFELVEQIRAGTFVGEEDKKKKKKKQKKTSGADKSGKAKEKASAKGKNDSGGNKEKTEIRLENFDKDMQEQIRAELKKRERRRKAIVISCSLTAVLCFAYFGLYNYFGSRTENTYSEWAALREKDDGKSNEAFAPVTVHLTEQGEAPDILEKYKTLYNKNKSLIGWIKIADTNIDYPVMQTSNNDYYLDHNLNQEYDKNGSIFLDMECDVLKPSTNLIVYGHHMQSGKMFGGLDQYSKEAYYKEHPTIEFDTIYEEGTWQIMYVFRSRIYTADEIVFKYYQFIDANSPEEFDSNMRQMSEMALYDTGVTASYGDRLLTLSTCDYTEEDGRFVVVAKKVN